MSRYLFKLPTVPRVSLTTTALSLAALMAAGCDRTAPEPTGANVQVAAPAEVEANAAPIMPAPLPALSRADLVKAAAEAASAYAAGTVPTDADPLAGRSFSVRLPFGCSGPVPGDAERNEGSGLATWAWAPDRAAIRLRMTPSDWTGSALLAEAGTADKWEAVEGFWIPRPWLTSDTCPLVQADPLQAGAPTISPQTVGLAAVFETGGSRRGRRNGRAYEHVIRPTDEAPLASPKGGYRMLLEGRITAFPSGRAVTCRAPGPDQRPVCIVAAQLDRVAFEDSSGDMLSEWRPG